MKFCFENFTPGDFFWCVWRSPAVMKADKTQPTRGVLAGWGQMERPLGTYNSSRKWVSPSSNRVRRTQCGAILSDHTFSLSHWNWGFWGVGGDEGRGGGQRLTALPRYKGILVLSSSSLAISTMFFHPFSFSSIPTIFLHPFSLSSNKS